MDILEAPSKRQQIGIYGIYLAIVLLVFISTGVANSNYGYYDDYMQLYSYQHGLLKFPTSFMHQAGRPVQDLISRPLFNAIDSIEGLKWIRMLNLLLSAFFAAFLVFILRNISRLRLEACFLALMATMTPAIGIYIAFACMVQAPFSLLISGWSGYLCYSIWLNNNLPRTKRFIGLALGFSGILIAEASYQPSAAAFLLPFILGGLRYPPSKSSNILLLKGCALFLIGMIAYFAFYKTSLEMWVGYGWYTGRGDVSLNMIKQLGFFLKSTLPLLGSNWEVFRMARPASPTCEWMDGVFNPAMAISILGLTLYAWLFPVLTRGKQKSSWIRSVLLFTAFGLIIAPIIASSERYFNLRNFPVIYISIILSSGIGATYLFRDLRTGISRSLGICILAVLSMYFSYQLYEKVRYLIVVPSEIEYSLLKAEVEEQFKEYPQAAAYVTPENELLTNYLPHTRVSDYGHRLATLQWGPKFAIRLILNKKLTNSIQYLPSTKVEVLFLHSNAFVATDWVSAISGEKIYNDGRFIQHTFDELSIDDPKWGPIIQYERAWNLSPEFGYINTWYDPWVIHLQLGYMYYNESLRTFSLEHEKFGNIECSADDFSTWKSPSGQLYQLVVENGNCTIVEK